jgi:3-oxoacyl-[acyl-carrier protein] reductase
VDGFTRVLAGQAHRFGISVNAVTPGPGSWIRDSGVLGPEQHRADVAETIALRRFGSAAQVADLVASLLGADTPQAGGRVLEVPTAIAF